MAFKIPDPVWDNEEKDLSDVEERDNFSHFTKINESHGIVSVGNTFKNDFSNCQNLSVYMHKTESRESPMPASCQTSSALPNEVDLVELQDSLRLLYTGEEAWMIPFPWMESRKFEPEDYFIHMDIEELDRKGEKIVRPNVQLENILEPLDSQTNLPPRRILLQAEAGFGKSTTCIRIAYDWSSKTKTNFHNFELVILVKLRGLVESLDDYVLQFAVQSCKDLVPNESMKTFLSRLRHKLLLILDGLDECPEDAMKSVERVIAFDRSTSNQSYLRGATVFMTTRPNLVSKIKICSDRHIRIRSMSAEERDIFVRKYFVSEELCGSVQRLLSGRSFQWDLSPLMLFLICYLEEEGHLASIQDESEVFYQILTLLGKRYVSKEQLRWRENETEEKLVQLGELCFELLKRQNMFIKKEDVLRYCSCPEHFVTGCGVFRREITYSRHSDDTYEPVHKRFVEYLAVKYLQVKFDKCSCSTERLILMKTMFHRRSPRARRVVVYDFENENEICFHSYICEDLIKVFVTLFPGKGTKPRDLKVEILHHSESVARLQNWRCYRSTLCLQATVLLTMAPDDHYSNIKYIPKRFREVIGHFFDEFGCVACDFSILRKCACTIGTKLLTSDEIHVKQLVHFGYYEKNKTCTECSFLSKTELVKMILRAERQATCFTLRRIPVQVRDTQLLLSEMCLQDVSSTKNLNVKVNFRGDINGISTVLLYALNASEVPVTSFGTFERDSIGRFLIWILRCFGLPGNLLSSPGKQQCLRIIYGHCTYSFVKNDSETTAHSYNREGEHRNLSQAYLKKLTATWRNEPSDASKTLFELNYFNSIKILNCDITVSPRDDSKTLLHDYLTWRNLKT